METDNSLNPLISVVIPAYNRESLIKRAIKSVLSQEYSNIEVIVVDDASSDNTPNVVESIDDDRISLIRLDKNRGASGARNEGIKKSKGEFITFVDSDDEWLSCFLETHLEAYKQHPSLDATFSGFIRHYNRSSVYVGPQKGSLDKQDLLNDILHVNFITPQTLMLRKECFEKIGYFEEDLTHREDWDFGIRLLSSVSIHFIDKPLTVVYETPGNLTSDIRPQIYSRDYVVNKHFNLFKNNPKALAQHYIYMGNYHIKHNNASLGRKQLYSSLKYRITIKAIILLFISTLGSRNYSAISNFFKKFSF